MATKARPLSPHLQVYRPQITSVMSISHRITGVALAVGTLLLVCWIGAAASGADAYATVQGFIGNWFGQLLLLGWSFCLFYHLANGIRHLFWDAGKGFEIETMEMSGKLVIAAAVILTVLAWGIALTMGA
jgi:succinate dehydrogenase / fumarate reductase cytochrome b subunit